MRALIAGTVVETEADKFNDTPFYAAFVQLGSLRDGAQRVKLSAEQFVKVRQGDEVEWWVDVTFSTFDGRARQSCKLPKEWLPVEGGNRGQYLKDGEGAAGGGKRHAPAASAS